MHLEDFMAAHEGVARRSDALEVCGRATIDNAVRSGRLIAPQPGIIADGWLKLDRDAELRSASEYVDGRGCLIGAMACEAWDLLEPRSDPSARNAVAVERGRRLLGRNDLQVREMADIETRHRPRKVKDLWVCDLESAIVTGWCQLEDESRRAAAIIAIRERRTTPQRLLARSRREPRLRDRAGLEKLCELLAQGAHSEFEIWGIESLFVGDLLKRSVGQRLIEVDGRRFYADRAFDEEQVAAEMDGTKWHDRNLEQRERDQVRDETIGRVGWYTFRVAYRRAKRQAAHVQQALRETLGIRRTQFRLPAFAA